MAKLRRRKLERKPSWTRSAPEGRSTNPNRNQQHCKQKLKQEESRGRERFLKPKRPKLRLYSDYSASAPSELCFAALPQSCLPLNRTSNGATRSAFARRSASSQLSSALGAKADPPPTEESCAIGLWALAAALPRFLEACGLRLFVSGVLAAGYLVPSCVPSALPCVALCGLAFALGPCQAEQEHSGVKSLGKRPAFDLQIYMDRKPRKALCSSRRCRATE